MQTSRISAGTLAPSDLVELPANLRIVVKKCEVGAPPRVTDLSVREPSLGTAPLVGHVQSPRHPAILVSL